MHYIVGAFTNYSFSEISPWLKSIQKSGFDGTIVVVAYQCDFDTVFELRRQGCIVFTFKQNESEQRFEHDLPFNSPLSILVERFFHLYSFLETIAQPNDLIIATDMRDVYFQRDPVSQAEELLKGGHEIICISEELKYQDSPWNENNLRMSFGDSLFHQLKDKSVVNAGVIVGLSKRILPLFLDMYRMCKGPLIVGSPYFIPGGGGPDQSALNILIRQSKYEPFVKITGSNSGLAVNLGNARYLPSLDSNILIGNESVRFVDSEFVTEHGEKIAIVHQRDKLEM